MSYVSVFWSILNLRLYMFKLILSCMLFIVCVLYIYIHTVDRYPVTTELARSGLWAVQPPYKRRAKRSWYPPRPHQRWSLTTHDVVMPWNHPTSKKNIVFLFSVVGLQEDQINRRFMVSAIVDFATKYCPSACWTRFSCVFNKAPFGMTETSCGMVFWWDN